MLKHFEDNFLFYWCMFILFCAGLFLGSEIRLMQMDLLHNDYLKHLSEVKNECNDKIAQARGLQ